MEKFKVTFYPDDKVVQVEKDKTILSAANSLGIYLNSSCGGDGVCGKCKVILKKGHLISQASGILSEEEKAKGVYLACLAAIHSDVEVEIPPQSRLDFKKYGPQFYSPPEEIEQIKETLGDQTFFASPFTTKLYLELPPPTLEDNVSDLERIYRKISKGEDIQPFDMNLANIKQLGLLLRDAEWKVTVTLGKRNNTLEIFSIEPGNTTDKNYGLAFDIGTTTISGSLVDLNSKKTLSTKISYNRQANFGSDVISRIIHAQKENGLEELHEAVIETMNEIIRELTQQCQVDLNNVTCVVCAGNTTMTHLLLSIEPSFIRKDPYVPTANFIPAIRAAEADIHIGPHGVLSCVPGVSSYIGGDVTAGILSSGLYRESDLSILIDIGTNGEIVLGNKEFLVACAASAGPAFEGSGVSSGMRASRNAIQKINIDPKDLSVNYSTIGGTRPEGICGSGYIDLLAQMLNAGIIDKGGRIILENKRIRNTPLGKEFVVAYKEETVAGSDITINEPDIDNLKRAKAAIYAASSILIRHMGLGFQKINKFFIAGGFGAYIAVENSVRIGLLPDLPREKFIFIGNSSLAGASQLLLSLQARRLSEEIARKVSYFELSTDSTYMDEYMAALFFPHTDIDRFSGRR